MRRAGMEELLCIGRWAKQKMAVTASKEPPIKAMEVNWQSTQSCV